MAKRVGKTAVFSPGTVKYRTQLSMSSPRRRIYARRISHACRDGSQTYPQCIAGQALALLMMLRLTKYLPQAIRPGPPLIKRESSIPLSGLGYRPCMAQLVYRVSSNEERRCRTLALAHTGNAFPGACPPPAITPITWILKAIGRSNHQNILADEELVKTTYIPCSGRHAIPWPTRIS